MQKHVIWKCSRVGLIGLTLFGVASCGVMSSGPSEEGLKEYVQHGFGPNAKVALVEIVECNKSNGAYYCRYRYNTDELLKRGMRIPKIHEDCIAKQGSVWRDSKAC